MLINKKNTKIVKKIKVLRKCCVGGCSTDHSPPLVSFSRPLRTALLRACSQPHVLLLLAAAHLFVSLVLLASRISPLLVSFRISLLSLLAAAAHITSRRSWPLVSPVEGCSPEHFSLAHLPRLAAYLRRRCSRVRFVRSFAHWALSLALASLSLRSALLCSAHAFALLVPRLQPLLSSCLASPLFPGSTPLISC